MKKKFFFLFFLLIIFIQSPQSQDNNEILLTIHDRKITKAEFERIYRKNNRNSSIIDKKSLEEYLDLFINFKLKVIEAKELGLDITASFIKEFEGYRKQLAKPYLIDNKTNEELISEAYKRIKQEVRASHILIRVDINATPEDTLFAYNKTLNIRERLLEGEPFEIVAKRTSDDPSVKNNGGDLGYFTAFQMPYSFETAAYNTNVSELSMPVTTRFGYHIIKVTDKRVAQGQIKVAHILLTVSQGAKQEEKEKARKKIVDIYEQLKNDEDFGELAKKYSEDPGTAKNGGELPWFGVGRIMVREFENAAFALKKNGDISGPVRTSVGWHIIKRIDKKEIESFDEMKTQLENKISKDERALISKMSFIQKLKREYKFEEDTKMLNAFYQVVDNSVFEGKWDIAKAKTLDGTLFILLDSKFSQQDFARFLAGEKIRKKPIPIKNYVDKMYEDFVNETVIQFEEKRLEDKYPEFKYLLNEYHDGILLFELTDRMVWSKAINDTIGLKEFYEKNKNNYFWEKRIDATIFTCSNNKTAKKAKKLVNKRAKKEYSDEDILNKININAEENLLAIENEIFSKGDNEFTDLIKWDKGISKNINQEGKTIFVVINQVIYQEPKSLQQAKGIITADYQTYLEKLWIEKLKKKYKVTVSKKVLSTIN